MANEQNKRATNGHPYESRLNNHKLTVDIPQDVLFVPMDGKLIEQVIINLVDNAVKYTPENGNIEVVVGT